MTVVRQSCGERWSVVKGVLLLALRELELFVESIDLVPVLEHLNFLVWKAGLIGN